MKLSVSNIAWKREHDSEMYALLCKYGYKGLEIAPTRIFELSPYERLEDARTFKEELLRDYGLAIPSMQSIWYGGGENIFSSPEERAALISYTRKAVDFAASIGSHNLVFGCPRNRNIPSGASMDAAVGFFREIGEYAAFRNTVIGMEANPPIYNTNYINTTAEAVELVRTVASEGFKLNFDLGTVIYNGESLDIIEKAGELINHVHISEPGLAPIQKRSMHEELKARLSAIGYSGFVSLEMGSQEDMSAACECIKYVSEAFL